MKVHCQSCASQFDVPVRSAGHIDYDGCQNVFRVSYRFRTPCPKCKKVLQLAPHDRNGAIGIVIATSSNEKTEAYAVSSDNTLPREVAAAQDNPLPTVRVARIEPAPVSLQVPTKVKPFRFVDHGMKRPSPLHVAVRPRKRSALPLLKFLLGFLIAGATTVTIILTVMATRSNPAPASAPSEAISKRQAAPPELPAEPQGGPEEAYHSSEPRVPPQILVKPAPASKKVALMRLPKLDRLTSSYGVRLDPFDNTIEFHSGVDFKAEYRAEVKATLDGRVSRVGSFGTYGNVVFITHPDGYESRYAHLAKVLVKPGKQVKQGDLIGLAGSTGRSTGTHVHFELLKDGKRIDPLRARLISHKS